jgi:hypothetical protein
MGTTSGFLFLETSARFRISVTKLTRGCDSFITAVALARPHHAATALAPNITQGDKSAKSVSRDIQVSGHCDLSERLLCEVAADVHHNIGRCAL